MKRKGLSLVELLVVIVVGTIAVVAVTSLVVESYRNWNLSIQKKSLQEELDLACYSIKGTVEEAKKVEIEDPGPSYGTKLVAEYDSVWQKEFYPRGTTLVIRNKETGEITTVIDSLSDISFQKESQSETILVNITVRKAGATLSNSFAVFLRNKE